MNAEGHPSKAAFNVRQVARGSLELEAQFGSVGRSNGRIKRIGTNGGVPCKHGRLIRLRDLVVQRILHPAGHRPASVHASQPEAHNDQDLMRRDVLISEIKRELTDPPVFLTKVDFSATGNRHVQAAPTLNVNFDTRSGVFPT
jgi:hypothetical protein